MKNSKDLKKLVLNKETISNLEILSSEFQQGIKAGYKACWENLWTAYYCDKIWTGKDRETQNVAAGVALQMGAGN